MERTHDANESFEYSAKKKVFILDTFILLARPLKQENNDLLATYKPYSCSRAAAASLRVLGVQNTR